jgi:hypothetical protein
MRRRASNVGVALVSSMSRIFCRNGPSDRSVEGIDRRPKPKETTRRRPLHECKEEHHLKHPQGVNPRDG